MNEEMKVPAYSMRGRRMAVETAKTIKESKDRGLSQSATIRDTGLSYSTVRRYWNGLTTQGKYKKVKGKLSAVS
ncbi:hypothetical protein [Photobacterium indicum]|uniref:hypothetical protein n=1 Tax=Photobacterium indicum TaxID=81447 RepID=UPI003D0DE742